MNLFTNFSAQCCADMGGAGGHAGAARTVIKPWCPTHRCPTGPCRRATWWAALQKLGRLQHQLVVAVYLYLIILARNVWLAILPSRHVAMLLSRQCTILPSCYLAILPSYSSKFSLKLIVVTMPDLCTPMLIIQCSLPAPNCDQKYICFKFCATLVE